MPYLPPFLRASLTGWFRVDAFDESNVLAPRWKDLSGLGNDLVGAAGVAYPGAFGGADVFVGPDLVNFMGTGAGTVLIAARPDAIVASTATVTNQDCLWCSGTVAGGYLRDNAGVRTYTAQHNDGASDAVVVTPANGLPDGEVAIFMWTHAGSANLHGSVDDLLKASVASGASIGLGNPFRLGLNNAGTAGFTGKIFEVLVWSITFNDEKLSQAINYLAANWSRRGNPFAQARARASQRLWEFRRPPVQPTVRAVPLDVLDVDLLADLTAIHPLGLRPAGAGWGEEAFERGELRVLQKDLALDEMALSLVCRDLRHHRAILALGDLPVQGGNLERGDGLLVVAGDLRVSSLSATKSWLLGGANQVVETRSSAERLLRAADFTPEGAHNDGMLLESAVTNKLLRSSFVAGTTGLTLTGSGAGGRLISAIAPSEPYFDTSVTPNLLAFDGGTVSAALYATWPVVAMAANEKFCLGFWFDGSEAASYLQYQLQRSTDSRYWDDATQTWVVASTWNFITNMAGQQTGFSTLRAQNPAVLISAMKTGLIDFGGSAGNLTVRIGEAACVTGSVKLLYHVQLQSESAVITTPVVTNAATVRRAMSYQAITPGAGVEGGDCLFVSDTSYTVLAELVPLWAPADVATGAVKTLLDQGGTWIYWDKATASWVWLTTAHSLGAAHNPVIGTRLRLAFRMADTADGGAAARSKSIFVDGVKVASLDPGANNVNGSRVCYLGRRMSDESSATDIHGGLDCIRRRLVVVPYAMTDAEIAAW